MVVRLKPDRRNCGFCLLSPPIRIKLKDLVALGGYAVAPEANAMTRILWRLQCSGLAAVLAVLLVASLPRESVGAFQFDNISQSVEGEAFDHDYYGNGPDTHDQTVSG